MCLWLPEQGCMNWDLVGWDLLPHPPYSSDIAPPKHHLFLSLQNSLQGKSFIDLEDVKKYIENFFPLKPAKFYADGIFRLPDSRTKVINNNRSYFTEEFIKTFFIIVIKNAENFLDNLIANPFEETRQKHSNFSKWFFKATYLSKEFQIKHLVLIATIHTNWSDLTLTFCI